MDWFGRVVEDSVMVGNFCKTESGVSLFCAVKDEVGAVRKRRQTCQYTWRRLIESVSGCN